jgi:hypothetical protein
MAVPALIYWCENLTLKKQHGRRTETGDMKFLRSVAGYTLCDHTTNEGRRGGLNIYLI